MLKHLNLKMRFRFDINKTCLFYTNASKSKSISKEIFSVLNCNICNIHNTFRYFVLLPFTKLTLVMHLVINCCLNSNAIAVIILSDFVLIIIRMFAINTLCYDDFLSISIIPDLCMYSQNIGYSFVIIKIRMTLYLFRSFSLFGFILLWSLTARIRNRCLIVSKI